MINCFILYLNDFILFLSDVFLQSNQLPVWTGLVKFSAIQTQLHCSTAQMLHGFRYSEVLVASAPETQHELELEPEPGTGPGPGPDSSSDCSGNSPDRFTGLPVNTLVPLEQVPVPHL